MQQWKKNNGGDMLILERWIIFFVGIIFQSIGIALVVKSTLGTSPISTVPYVLSISFPMTFGQTTFIINMIFLIAQIFLLKDKFNRLQLLQAPVTFIFAAFIDIAMWIFESLMPDFYGYKLFILLWGVSFVSLGVALQVIANVLMLAGEALVTAISLVTKFEFGTIKTLFDCVLVATATIWSYMAIGTLEGIREGTLISALITGTISKLLIQYFSRIDHDGNRRLYLHI